MAAQHSQKPFVVQYLFTFIHQKNVAALEQITPLSKTFRAALTEAGYHISTLKLIETFDDPDGTMKFVFETADGNRLESVRLLDDQRATLCISTQVGCRMGCLFCATGQLGYQRDLTCGEIVDQVYQIQLRTGKAQNIVYMGMGEPLDNYEATMKSVELLNHPEGQNIGIRHITVSTCGLTEGIARLTEEALQPRLAISLHGPDDQTRQSILKISKKVPIRSLMSALRKYQDHTGRRITFEYCMIQNYNDSPQQARQLARLVKPFKCNVNLIEFNAFDGCDFVAASPAGIRQFAAVLEREGIETVIRYKRGRSIRAACGQLGADWLKRTT
ncbi:MAG: 23S rRNA (adenine(2503)-C(2))-methyltransferase RlmN [Sedimentisphaerales bacterium]|nr:23S rRNA (adenine(2503)-C(2))-methyltransferase RlmN [Sedimentisphaerales bacterium]